MVRELPDDQARPLRYFTRRPTEQRASALLLRNCQRRRMIFMNPFRKLELEYLATL